MTDQRTELGPWKGGINRKVADRSTGADDLHEARGFIGRKIGGQRGIREGSPIVKFGPNAPTRWLQWGGSYVQLDSDPTSEVMYSDGSIAATTIVPGSANGVIYDDKLFLAFDGSPARVYPDKTDLTKFCYLSEKIQQVACSDVDFSLLSGTTWRLTFDVANYPTGINFLVEPQYVLFKRDTDAGSTTAEVRAVAVADRTTGTKTTLDFDAPNGLPTGKTMAYVLLGSSPTDMLSPKTFFVWRERLGASTDRQVQFSGFPGAALPVFTSSNVLDWGYWDALNNRVIGTPEDGDIIRVLPQDDRIICGLRGPVHGAIYQVRGYPAINALIENQLVVEKISSELGFNSYDAAALDDDGLMSYFAFGNNIYRLNGVQPEKIDQAIEDHELRRGEITHIGTTPQVIAFYGDSHSPDRVALEYANEKSGILNQAPTVWIYDYTVGSWRMTQRVGTDADSRLIQFDSPGVSGGLGHLIVGSERFLAVGTTNGIVLLDDTRTSSTSITDFHIQTLITHRHTLGDPVLKRASRIVAHVEDAFDQDLPVAFYADSKNDVNGRAHFSFAKPRNNTGDITQYSTHGRGGRGSPRIGVGLGYYGDRLLAGDDREFTTYSSINFVQGAATKRMQQVAIDGRLDRIDVLAANVGWLTAVLYSDNNGVPGSAIDHYDITLPKDGLTSSLTPYWFPLHVGGVDLSGVFYIEIRGDADVSTHFAGTDIIDETGAVITANTNMAIRAVEQIGGPFVSSEIAGFWLDWQPMGNLVW